MEFDKLIKKLNGKATENERLQLLNIEYLHLYFLVCRVKKISTGKFRKFCKELDTKKNPELMAYHIHGWLLHHFEELNQQNKLQVGKKKINIGDFKCQYEGKIAGNKAYGRGVATSEGGDKYEATFIGD